MNFKKFLKSIEEHKKESLISFIVIFLLIGILSDVSHYYTGHFLSEPILKLITPTKLEVEISPWPQEMGGKKWTPIILHNRGLKDIKSIRMEYQDYCFQDKIHIATLPFTILEGGESKSFEYETEKDVSCSATADMPTISFYRDSRGNLYCDQQNNTLSVCLYCPLNVKVYSGFALIKDVNFSMPFFQGGLYAEIGSESCIPKSKAKEPEKLKLVQTSPRSTIMDISTMCLLGNLTAEWCRKNSYNPTYIK